MRITKVDIPKDLTENEGLDAIKMDKLGAVVLLTGKNGSGKTRILKKIFQTINDKPMKTRTESNRLQKPALEQSIRASKEHIAILENAVIRETDNYQNTTNQRLLLEEKQNSEHLTKQLQIIENELNWNLIELDNLYDAHSYINFVPKQLYLNDPTDYHKHDLHNNAQNISKIGVQNLHTGSLAKIQVIQDKWFNTTHQHSTSDPIAKAKATKDYEKLKTIIKTFLGAEIDRTDDGDASIFGFPIGKANLSDGQKILLQFCMAIYSQQEALNDLILIMDEPENHLHPSAIIEIIERIQECVPNGQIWISTHSVPLLAHFDPSQIWYVENSQVKHAGKIPEKVLGSLLGDENAIGKLQDFISLPAQLATSRYAFECLLEPAQVMTGSNDPQSRQIRTELLKISQNGKLRILDFGAGKGRLISNLADLESSDKEKLLSQIDYIAYDEFPTERSICEESIKRAFGNCDDKYFSKEDSLFSKYDKGSFDVVIMCNVLHEIEPTKWLNLFQKGGFISNCLKPNGILLLVEDQQIPTGEKAYQKGFLVLDTPELKTLFSITEKDHDFSCFDLRADGRLKAHQIPKHLLNQITPATRIGAIKEMADHAKREVERIRAAEKNYSNGKLHGFWTQQFANAQLILDELAGTNS